MKHLESNGSYKTIRPRGKVYTVRALFPNVNADYNFEIRALNKVNALWVAAEHLAGTGAFVGDIRRV